MKKKFKSELRDNYWTYFISFKDSVANKLMPKLVRFVGLPLTAATKGEIEKEVNETFMAFDISGSIRISTNDVDGTITNIVLSLGYPE